MAQTWEDDVYASGHNAATDLQNIENNFAALKSLFSGTTPPGSMAACHPWFDSAQHVLKIRADDDSAWFGLMHGDVDQKIWVYRNSAMTGWAVDATVSDRVLAMKGGSTYTAGGAGAGAWLSDHTHGAGSYAASHGHKWYESHAGSPSNDKTFDVSGNEQNFGWLTLNMNCSGLARGTYEGSDSAPADAWTDLDAGTVAGTSGSGGNGSSWRPTAAVGTLQYLDL